ncbi:MAG: transposase [Nostoc sp.]|uniref:IS66 family transposase n=1 Tax=Nostoc sp. TaxID=1180 RepID=UPI002FF64365
MSNLPLNKDIPESERTPLVEWLLNIIAEQQQIIDKLSSKVCQLELHVENLDEQLLVAKKMKGKPKIRASTLNQTQERTLGESKRAGSAKRSKKTSFVADEERVIEPIELPESAKFNGYREYDVQDLVLKRHNIRFLLAEYVTSEGKTIVGKLPEEYQGHYGVALRGFVIYQHHQCRVPQPIIVEQLRELGIDISSGQVNRILICDKESFHAEQKEVLSAGLETAEYVHTDDTGARHKGKNGYCTVIGNDLFTYFSSSESKSRDNYLRILRATDQDFVLNEYSRSYLITQQLSLSTMVKLQFDNISICQTDEEWQAYLKQLGITSQSGVKLVTEAALLGSAIEHGLSPDMIILSDGARQFAILVHALCWVHAERGIRRLKGVTTQQLIEIESVQDALWKYYHQLKAYRDFPSEMEKQRLTERFDEIFGKRYKNHYGLNLAMQQFCAHKEELLRVLDAPQLPLHTNAAEADIREYVTRRKISGGTRHDDGRRARDTFTGLKKTCRKLAYSFWQYLISRLKGDESIPYLPDVIRAKAALKNEVFSIPIEATILT